MFTLKEKADYDGSTIFIIEDDDEYGINFCLAMTDTACEYYPEPEEQVALWVESNPDLTIHMEVDQALAVAHKIIQICSELKGV